MSLLEAWWERRSLWALGRAEIVCILTPSKVCLELKGQAPCVSPLRLEHLALRGPRGCCVEGQNSSPLVLPTPQPYSFPLALPQHPEA